MKVGIGGDAGDHGWPGTQLAPQVGARPQVRQVTTTAIAASPGDHLVQFYSGDDELTGTVSGYLADGVRSGCGALVVATAPHRRASRERARFGRYRRSRGTGQPARSSWSTRPNCSAVSSSRRLDRERRGRFQSWPTACSSVLRTAGAPCASTPRCVALLWDARQVALAIELEELWNELGTQFPFWPPCAPIRPRVVADGRHGRHPGGAAGVIRLSSPLGLADPVPLPASCGRRGASRGELNSAQAARHYATGLLDRADAAIVATELAANAVLHARSGFTLTVSRSPAALRIAVRDYAPLESGSIEVKKDHGLGVVSQLATRWFCRPAAGRESYLGRAARVSRLTMP